MIFFFICITINKMEITDELKLDLAKCIVDEFEKEFSVKFVSGNLIRSIHIEKTEKGYAVIIDAQIYDMVRFQKYGVVVPNGKGGYAAKVNKTGGFSRSHKGYVDRCIAGGINAWQTKNNLKINKKIMKDE